MPLPTHDLQSLASIHQEAALLLAQGYNRAEVAAHLSITAQTLQVWIHSPIFKNRVKEIQRELAAESIDYAITKTGILQARAVDRLEHLMEHSVSESVQLGAVRDILERGPLRIQRGGSDQKVSTGTVILSKDMLIAMSRVAEMTGDQHLLESMQALPIMSEPEPQGE